MCDIQLIPAPLSKRDKIVYLEIWTRKWVIVNLNLYYPMWCYFRQCWGVLSIGKDELAVICMHSLSSSEAEPVTNMLILASLREASFYSGTISVHFSFVNSKSMGATFTDWPAYLLLFVEGIDVAASFNAVCAFWANQTVFFTSILLGVAL